MWSKGAGKITHLRQWSEVVIMWGWEQRIHGLLAVGGPENTENS